MTTEARRSCCRAIPAVTANYPVAAVKTAFAAAAAGHARRGRRHGHLIPPRHAAVDAADLRRVRARPTSRFRPGRSPATAGSPGAHTAEVEVSAIVERQTSVDLSLRGLRDRQRMRGAVVCRRRDDRQLRFGRRSARREIRSLDNYGGNVGTNGNLTEVGNPTTHQRLDVDAAVRRRRLHGEQRDGGNDQRPARRSARD